MVRWTETRVDVDGERVWNAPNSGALRGLITRVDGRHAVVFESAEDEWLLAVDGVLVPIPEAASVSAEAATRHAVSEHVGRAVLSESRDRFERRDHLAACFAEACTEMEKLAAGIKRARKQQVKKKIIDEAARHVSIGDTDNPYQRGSVAHAVYHKGKRIGSIYQHWHGPRETWSSLAHSNSFPGRATDRTLGHASKGSAIKHLVDRHLAKHEKKKPTNESVDRVDEEMRIETGTNLNRPVVAHYKKLDGKMYRRRFNNMTHLLKWRKEKKDLHSIKRVFNEDVGEETELGEQIKGWKNAYLDVAKSRSRQAAIARGEDPDKNKKKSNKPEFSSSSPYDELHRVVHKRTGDTHRLVKQGDSFWTIHHTSELGARGVPRAKTYTYHLGTDAREAASQYNDHLRRNGFNVKPKK